MENNIIYALQCPIHKMPVYIGQSSTGMDRPFEHIKEKSHSRKVNEWMKYLKDQGLHSTIIVLEHDFESKYLNVKEEFWINRYLHKGSLLFNQQNVNPEFYQVIEFDAPPVDFLYEVRLFIKARRRLLKLTQAELANKAGVGIRFVRELEQGSKSNFNTKSIEKILRLLGNVKLSVISCD